MTIFSDQLRTLARRARMLECPGLAAELDALAEAATAPAPPKPAEVIAHAAQAFGVFPDDITGQTREARIVLARHAAAYALRKRGLGWKEIAYVLGRADHTTARYAVLACERRMVCNEGYAARVRLLCEVKK